MKNFMFPFNGAARVAALSSVFAVLAACGGSGGGGNNNAGDDHEHDHGALLVSQSGSQALSLVDEGSLESLDSLGFVGATFVRSDNGEFAAIKGDGSTIYFAGEDGLSEHDVLGTDVIATNGHFSVLNAGSSTFIEVESLESDTLESEDTSSLSVTEVYPAVLLDEAGEIFLVFTSGKANIYEDGSLEEQFDCTSPSSVAQAGHAVIMSCDEGVHVVHVEEGELEITYEIDENITLDGIASSYIWQGYDHVFAGYVPGSTDYALIHFEEEEILEPADSGVATVATNICAASVEAEDGDFLLWLSGGNFVALNHEGEQIASVTVDTSTSTDCDDYHLTATVKSAFVIDNDAEKFYEIDAHDGGNYHVHETLDMPVSDIAASVALFHNEAGHDHDHEHEEE